MILTKMRRNVSQVIDLNLCLLLAFRKQTLSHNYRYVEMAESVVLSPVISHQKYMYKSRKLVGVKLPFLLFCYMKGVLTVHTLVDDASGD